VNTYWSMALRRTCQNKRRANFTLKLVRPGFGPAAELPPSRERAGVTAVAARDSFFQLIRGNHRAAPASSRATGRTA
jgi:hypothetical protein